MKRSNAVAAFSKLPYAGMPPLRGDEGRIEEVGFQNPSFKNPDLQPGEGRKQEAR